jgi:hypothetical protein
LRAAKGYAIISAIGCISQRGHRLPLRSTEDSPTTDYWYHCSGIIAHTDCQTFLAFLTRKGKERIDTVGD